MGMENLLTLRCLLVQSELFWGDARANRQCLEAIVRAHHSRFDLAVFPETFSSGFLGDLEAKAEGMEGATVRWLRELAAELECVLCGSAVISSGERKANRFLWAQPDGGVQFYDKHHLFGFGGEDARYTAGSERRVFHYRGWRICPQICYDLRFPAWCRNRADYDLLLCVANWPQPRTAAWSALLRARAIENQCYVIGVNRAGNDPRGLEYAGASAVYDPLGETLLDLGEKAAAAVVEISLPALRHIREQLPFAADADDFNLRA